jgi:5-formyltetrahydrofolate cyclo-ligase
MNRSKQQLRQDLKQARLEMTEADRTVKSRQIIENLKQATDWSQVKTMHYFEPLRRLMEPDISGFITHLEDNYPDLKLFTPRLIGNEWDLVAVRGGQIPDKFDVVIVPMLGFDESLQRIGYGGGYYDKFLATQSQAQKIGVCFETGRVEGIPAEPYDIPLNQIITEKNTYS